MTSHAPYPLNYTEGRDAQGHHLGLVNPGDIRDLDEAPDQHWHETTDEDRAALAAREAAVLQEHPGYGEPMTGTEHPADGTWSPPVTNEPGPREAPGEPVTQAPEQTEPGF